MGKRLPDFLALVRAPGAFIVLADVLAGWIAASGGSFRILSLLLAASACIYGAGCVLNDIRDKDKDLRENPGRPIPSGAVKLKEAKLLALFLFSIGLLSAYAASFSSFIAALVLTGLAVSYNAAMKEIPVAGPVNMGACRAMNLMLGMSAGAAHPHLALLPVITLAYGACVTAAGKSDGGWGIGKRAALIAGWGIAVVLLLILSVYGILQKEALFFVAIFAAATGPLVMSALKGLTPEAGKGALKAFVLAFPFLDAVYASGAGGFLYGVPVALLAAPAALGGFYGKERKGQ